MIGCVPKLNGLSNLAPTGKMTASSTFSTTPFLFFCYCLVPCQKTRFYTCVSWGLHTNVKSGISKKTRTFFKKNKSFFKNSMAFWEKT